MGLFNNIFSRKKEAPKKIFPSRGLNLKVAPIPENGKELSRHFIEAVKDIEDIELNLEVDSLVFVDSFLDGYSKEYDVETFAETIFVAGCFAGEIMVKNAEAKWINSSDAELPEGVNMMPIVIKLPNDVVCDPIAKAFKRFGNGTEDDLVYFYQVFTNINSEKNNKDAL